MVACVAVGASAGPDLQAVAAAEPASSVEVHDAAELTTALQDARPGDTIQLADGTYAGHFQAATSGTEDAPITRTGSAGAVLDGGGSGYGFHLDSASYWALKGFTIQNSQKGLMGDGANHNVIDHLQVQGVGDEGIHFRCASSDNVVQDSTITDTGRVQPQYGEGVYLGSAHSNWDRCDGGGEDHSDRNRVSGNVIGPDVRAESVDVKEGTTGGVISGNTFDGTGMSGENYADSWLDVKGNGYQIIDNRGSHALLDGFQVHEAVDSWGSDNFFARNNADVGADGYGFDVDGDDRGNIVCADNTVTNAGSGAANVDLTDPCPITE
ncbi:hypothetical protein VV02_12980 [Luteipulveratus mongoliensis]|uniref:Uncharacterized protein n=1 Tax=Luteipulveratus mongoliensis TaxID=571913 RepID=A0A0K1JIN1_9MICO|nr:hypothetical protein VV02_12980 [Luteipulveratus mongoliensis]